jgi:hypothetical protein
MNIASAKYIEDEDGSVMCIKATINGKEWFVPINTSNTHYAEIQRQVAVGELTIADAD